MIPYNALDYISGVTGIGLPAYIIAMVGMLPGTVTMCFLGGSMSSITDRSVLLENTTMKIVTIVSGVIFSFGLCIAMWWNHGFSVINFIMGNIRHCWYICFSFIVSGFDGFTVRLGAIAGQ